MTKREPICLKLALAPLLGTILSSVFFWTATNYGGSAGIGQLLIIGIILVLLYPVGFILAVVSLIRREKYPLAAIFCLLIYIVPIFLAGILILNRDKPLGQP